MEATLNNLKVRFVAKFTYIFQTALSGRGVQVKQYEGDVHLFETYLDENKKMQLSPLSFCGIERAKIGELTDDSEKRQLSKLCPSCEAAWKAHPRSPWKAWNKTVVSQDA